MKLKTFVLTSYFILSLFFNFFSDGVYRTLPTSSFLFKLLENGSLIGLSIIIFISFKGKFRINYKNPNILYFFALIYFFIDGLIRSVFDHDYTLSVFLSFRNRFWRN